MGISNFLERWSSYWNKTLYARQTIWWVSHINFPLSQEYTPCHNMSHWSLNKIDDILQTFSNTFLRSKLMYLYSNFTEICFWWSNWQSVSTGSDNGLVHGHQAIIWTSDDPAMWHIHVSPYFNVLIIYAFSRTPHDPFNSSNLKSQDCLNSIMSTNKQDIPTESCPGFLNLCTTKSTEYRIAQLKPQ